MELLLQILSWPIFIGLFVGSLIVSFKVSSHLYERQVNNLKIFFAAMGLLFSLLIISFIIVVWIISILEPELGTGAFSLIFLWTFLVIPIALIIYWVYYSYFLITRKKGIKTLI